MPTILGVSPHGILAAVGIAIGAGLLLRLLRNRGLPTVAVEAAFEGGVASGHPTPLAGHQPTLAFVEMREHVGELLDQHLIGHTGARHRAGGTLCNPNVESIPAVDRVSILDSTRSARPASACRVPAASSRRSDAWCSSALQSATPASTSATDVTCTLPPPATWSRSRASVVSGSRSASRGSPTYCRSTGCRVVCGMAADRRPGLDDQGVHRPASGRGMRLLRAGGRGLRSAAEQDRERRGAGCRMPALVARRGRVDCAAAVSGRRPVCAGVSCSDRPCPRLEQPATGRGRCARRRDRRWRPRSAGADRWTRPCCRPRRSAGRRSPTDRP